jgi:hypothetical protein
MMYRILILVLTALWAGPAFSQASFTAKDASGATQTFKSIDCSSTICPISSPVDATGSAFGVTGNPFFVTNNGTFAVQATLTAETTKVIGTVRIASGGVASGSYASGAFATGAFATGSIASGAVASGAYSSGAFASGSIASGALASGSIASGAMVDFLTTVGTKNNGTAATNAQLVGLVYNSTPLTLTNTQQSSLQGSANGSLYVAALSGGFASGSFASGAFASGSHASGSIASGAFASGAVSSGAFASGSIASGAMVDFLTTVGSKAAGTAATSAQLTGCVYNSSAPTPTNGQQVAIQCDSSGNIKTVGSGPADNAIALASLQTAPVSFIAQTTNTTCNDGNNCIPRVNPATRALRMDSVDPCSSVAKTTVVINQTATSGTNVASASASNKTYICSLVLNANGGANVFSIVEDDTSGCGSPTAALVGSTTASEGISVSQYSGWSSSGGGNTIVAGGTANRYVCVIQSSANRLSGYVTYVQAP